MSEIEIFQRLAVALSIGTLVGVERGWQTREAEDSRRTAGLRTFALIGLGGGVLGLLAEALGPLPFAVGGLAAIATVAAFRWRGAGGHGDLGVTTVIAALCVYALGGYAAIGSLAVAAAAAVAMTLFLALKSALHGALRKLSWKELRAALILLAMTFIVLPVLPDQGLGPYSAFNPHLIWVMTVLIAAVGFAGYVAIRTMGERHGIMLAGLVGGLASSTATTLSLARFSRLPGGNPAIPAAGILMSFAVMYLRVPAVAFVLAPGLGLSLAVPALASALVSTAGAALLLRRAGRGGSGAPLQIANPLDHWQILKFGALIAAVSVAATILSETVGEQGTFALAFVSGLADVDAPTVSLASMAGGSLTREAAATGIALAVLANMLSKTALCWILARPATAWPVTIVVAVGLAAAGAVMLAMTMLPA